MGGSRRGRVGYESVPAGLRAPVRGRSDVAGGRQRPGSDRSASHRILSTDPPGRDPAPPRGVAAGWVKRWRGDEGSHGGPGC